MVWSHEVVHGEVRTRDGRRRLIALAIAEIVSTTGSEMTWLALPWLVLTTTGSATRMGFVMAAYWLPVILLGVPSGLFISRFGPRRTMMIADGVRAVFMVALMVLSEADLLGSGVILVSSFVLGLFFAPYLSCQRLVVAETFGDDSRLTTRANAVIQVAARTSALVGPALGGVLLHAYGPDQILLIDAVGYLVALALIGLCVRPLISRSAAEGAQGPGMLWEGVLYLRRDPFLRLTAVSAASLEMCFQTLIVSFPVLAYDRYEGDPRVAGWLIGAWGLGSLVGGAVTIPLAARIDPKRLALVGATGQVLPIVLLGLGVVWQLPVMIALLALSGFFNPPTSAPLTALATVRSPPNRRAVVVTAFTTVSMIGGPLGLLGAGPLLDTAGITVAYRAVAVLSVASFLVLWRALSLRVPDPLSSADTVGHRGQERGEGSTAGGRTRPPWPPEL